MEDVEGGRESYFELRAPPRGRSTNSGYFGTTRFRPCMACLRVLLPSQCCSLPCMLSENGNAMLLASS
jgi:hypothetical protein